jgi:esterase/lipase
MQKVVYIIPGFQENSDAEIYKKISKSFIRLGIKPIFIHINWKAKNRLMRDYLKQFIDIYKKINIEDNTVYLFGFSTGAWIAFMASLEIEPKKVFLCSLSPYFKEDMKLWTKAWINGIGYNRFNDFKNHKFNSLVKRFKSKAIIFVGKNEDPKGVMIRRSNIAHESIKNSKLVIIPNAEHNIRQKEYLKAVKKYIK